MACKQTRLCIAGQSGTHFIRVCPSSGQNRGLTAVLTTTTRDNLSFGQTLPVEHYHAWATVCRNLHAFCKQGIMGWESRR